ncbi:hypothetical protein [Citricoccus sp. NR2]|uniref:hypothetical protein n=1 Tax=Citricoccus sp. NR2 TaxID=3004095 RepID=UPI0022DE0FA1|nr:hypothetical protein [Citricoccus sp. NR2]WBL20148.1 hypothetical protein O1A05_05565 [Citricoccus sp. NR2]
MLMTTVLGGHTSLHANFEELQRGAVLLDACVSDAEAMGARVAGWGAVSSLITWSAPSGSLLLARVASVSTGLVTLGTQLAGLHRGVVASIEAYRTVESAVTKSIDALMLPASAGQLALDLARGAPLRTADLERVLSHGPRALAGVLNGVFPGGSNLLGVATVTAVGMGRIDAWAQSSGPLESTDPRTRNERMWQTLSGAVSAAGVLQLGGYQVQRSAAPSHESVSDGSMTWLTQNLRRTFEDTAGSSALGVTRIDASDGQPTWVVAIPGTQFGSVNTTDSVEICTPEETGLGALLSSVEHEDNAWGASGVREAMALRSQHVVTAVDEALVAAGAQPGERIVTVGYSQGGSHAVNVATDPRIAEVYDVDTVVTYGGLSANVELPDDVVALHLEHEEDVAIALDGAPNPVGMQRTTVMFSGYTPEMEASGDSPQEAGFFGAAHGFDTYTHHVETSLQDPGVVEQIHPTLDHLMAVTAGPAVATAFTLRREKPDPPRNPLSGSSSSLPPTRAH